MPNEQDERDVLPDTTSGPPCDREVIESRILREERQRERAILNEQARDYAERVRRPGRMFA